MAGSAYPTTTWTTEDVAYGRRLGARSGFKIALGFVVLGGAVLAVEDPTTAGQTFGTLAIPTLIAGWFAGRRVGPRALRARTRRNWIAVIVYLSLVTIMVGGAGVGAALGLQSVGQTPVGPLEAIGGVLALAGLGATFGLVFAGPAALIFVLPAAWIWAWSMGRYR